MSTERIDLPLHQGTILVVDDDPLSLYLLSGTLESEGYDVERAQSGTKGLEIAESVRPDLILLDVVMPGIGGISTCERLKADPATAEIPVLFLSAQDDPQTKAEGFKAGGVDFINKPFDARELIARVNIHLTLRAQERQIQLYAESLESMINERTRRLSVAEDKLQRDYDFQRVLNAQLRTSIEGAPLRELLRTSLEQVLGLSWMPLENCGAIYLVDEARESMVLYASQCLVGQEKPKEIIPFERCPEEYLARGSEAVTVVDVPPAEALGGKAGDGESVTEEGATEETVRMVCIPISHGEQQYGVFMGRLAPGRELDVKEETFFAGLASTLGRLVLYKRTESQLRLHAYYDTLTGLPNRTLLLQQLGKEIELFLNFEQALSKTRLPAATQTTGDADTFAPVEYEGHCALDESAGYAVLLLDLDRFTTINESLGHNIGDQLIQALGTRLVTFLGKKYTVARLGGDEFAILLPHATRVRDTHALAQSLIELMGEPFVLEGHLFFMTVSIGVALALTDYDRAEDVLRDADAALHRAKSQGRARFEIFDRAMRVKALKSLHMVSDMRKALENKEFVLHYQPIVDLATGRLDGFEALVRWMHPERGMMPPDEFIPLAEETGLIIPLGEWVLREACREMGTLWTGGNTPKIAVNLSAKQFSQKELHGLVAEVLRRGECGPGVLKLEITESAVMEDVQAAVTKLSELKSLDVQLSIDDFGTGYSSLAYLQRFPVDVLKIDRSFVGRMDSSEENLEIVRTVVSLAHNMGMEVVAEGVETQEQMRLLQKLGCEYGQGYYFSRPVPMNQVIESGMCGNNWAE